MQEKFREKRGDIADRVIKKDLELRSTRTAMIYCSKHSLLGMYKGK